MNRKAFSIVALLLLLVSMVGVVGHKMLSPFVMYYGTPTNCPLRTMCCRL
jgi:hypothetical protein